MRYNFIFSLIFILVFQIVLQLILIQIGISGFWYNVIFDIVVALFFTFLDFRGREKLKNPAFHQTFAFYFVILTIISLLFGNY